MAEDHDPNEEYEEYMACAVCGDNCMWISFHFSYVDLVCEI